MRITNGMLAANSLWNINNNMRRLNAAQEQVSTERKIQLPSDDPGIATRAIKYRNYGAAAEQYQTNTEAALDWLNVTENALSAEDSGLAAVIQRVRELTVNAANETNSDAELQAIAEEIGQLKEETMQIMNTSFGGRYVFGGYATDEEPYTAETVNVGGVALDFTTYKGQYLNLTGPLPASADEAAYAAFYQGLSADQIYAAGEAQTIQYNIGSGTKLAVNVEGQDVIGQTSGSNLLATMDKLLLALNGETTYQTADIDASTGTVTLSSHDLSISDLLAAVDTDLERVLGVAAELGARENSAARVKSRLSGDETTYTKLLSNNEDVDIAEAASNLSTAQAVYEASLAVGAKVISKSLLDYLT